MCEASSSGGWRMAIEGEDHRLLLDRNGAGLGFASFPAGTDGGTPPPLGHRHGLPGWRARHSDLLMGG